MASRGRTAGWLSFVLPVVALWALSCTEKTTPVRVPMPDAELQILIDEMPVYDAYLADREQRIQPEVTLDAPVAQQRITYQDEIYSLQSEKIQWSCSDGTLTRTSRQNPEWMPPREAGDYRLTVTLSRRYILVSTSNSASTLESGIPSIVEYFISDAVYAIVPESADALVEGEINGYPIGDYPDIENANAPSVVAHREVYRRPSQFYRVTEENKDYRLSRRFRLGDFDLDFYYMRTGYPQYIALQRKFVRKLELVVDELNQQGYPVRTFSMISGYRSPHYHFGGIDRGDELKAKYSRHLWGDAADLIVDDDGDRVMDDLNGDGEHNCADAAIVFLAGREVDHRLARLNDPAVGGRGLYDHHDAKERDADQTPYVHIDARGYVHNDGRLYEWYEGCSPR